MHPVYYNQKLLTLFGVCVPSSDVTENEKLRNTIFSRIIFVMQVSNFTACTLSIIKESLNGNPEGAVLSLLEAVVLLVAAYSLGDAFMQSHTMFNIFTKMRQIFDESKYNFVFKKFILAQLNEVFLLKRQTRAIISFNCRTIHPERKSDEILLDILRAGLHHFINFYGRCKHNSLLLF